MAQVIRERKNFGKIRTILDVPNLIEIQCRSFEAFLQTGIMPDRRDEKGLQAAFQSVFPITDYNETASIEYIDYNMGQPKSDLRECLEKGTTYAAPLKIRVRLNLWEKSGDQRRLKDSREQEVYIGELPLMTETGTFVINGTERVVVSQLHRSPGVFFGQDKTRTHASGRMLYTARVIPARGSWLDLEFDAKDILNARIDRKRKLPVTTLLKALGYTNSDLLRMFYNIEKVRRTGGGNFVRSLSEVLVGVKSPVAIGHGSDVFVKEGGRITRGALRKMKEAGITEIPCDHASIIGRVTYLDIVDPSTGEIIIESNEEISEEVFARIISGGVTDLELLYIDQTRYLPSLRDTLLSDKTLNKDEAMIDIYRKLRPGEPPTLDAARQLFDGLFFDSKRYDLSPVGRLKLNKRMGLNVPLETRVLTSEDIISIVRYILELRVGRGEVDDIDHLGNRRIRAVGELLENQFRIGLVRMERAIKEKMSLSDLEIAMPHDLINAKPVMAAVKEFFGSSQLSQFMDQTNPLSEITHKRRLSALGPGGLTRERAGFEVRDVHTTHYGRICPIETPEGPNIGLITSLATYARVNDYGFIESPYRVVRDGRATSDIVYLSAIEGEVSVIAQANTILADDGKIVGPIVSVRSGGDFHLTTPDKVAYMDISPKQIVSVSTALIPFLENDDANRALMGSNMQRQAVPLLRSDAPVVGTGMEFNAARDSGVVVCARRSGIVESVDATRIVVHADGSDGGVDIYKLVKFRRSNQSTCITQKPIVSVGQRVDKGDVLADGPCTDMGELALGKNVLVAFMPWNGYNFEDAILLSERLVKDDVYTSIHIEEFEIEARETKLGREEITRDIPNVSEEALRNLDESGIIRIGAEVKAGDILVGKVTPKGETPLTPEERLLRAIFGEKAEEVRENCLYVPPGIEGTIVDVRVFYRKGVEKDDRTKRIENEEIQRLHRDLEEESSIIRIAKFRRMRDALEGRTVDYDVIHPETGAVVCAAGKPLLRKAIDMLPDSMLGRIRLEDEDAQIRVRAISEDTDETIQQLESRYIAKINRLRKGDELPPGVFKVVKTYIAMKRKIQVGDKMAGRHGNKGVVSMVMPVEDMPILPDGRPVDVVLNPLGVPSRMNVGQILETHLGWAAKTLGIHVATPVFEGATEADIKGFLEEAGLPASGQITLRDGRTGVPFDRPSTVGYTYILKLHHLVDDKLHARSIGPYSLVTQQPLGGKAQFGGQRLGEMEVWALEAYGAANTLQEFLTVKSDDITGRSRMYEAIVKGNVNLEPGIPESFHVLVKELQSLCLDVELLESRTDGGA
ncbi:MAG: DNA-directed RNA polymerase subunit beta [Nitrospirae bacterium]|nr:DNA-directed RNA polymerase subunit beta [Nitrospirota bacterium]